ncbi:hypothetical protein Tco_1469836, partial [Tanacetum coccineum]
LDITTALGVNKLAAWPPIATEDMDVNSECFNEILDQNERRQHGALNGKKANNDFNKKGVGAYEATSQRVVAENANLRALK